MESFVGSKLAVSICLSCQKCYVSFTCKLVSEWSNFSWLEKTIEGTAAGITSVLAACSALLPLLAITTEYILTWVYLSLCDLA